jgi:hypothetical protein
MTFANSRASGIAYVLCPTVVALMVTGSLLFALGCARTVTPAEVQALGRRPLPGRKQAETVKAVNTALRTLGFEVVVTDAGSGRVKTAPKPIVVHAVGYGGAAVAVSNEIAWTVDVSPSPDGVVVQLTPRASSAGQSYDGPWDADYVEKSISDLFAEIESDLPGGAPSKKAPASP